MGELGVVSQNTHRFGATPSLDPAGRTPAAPSTPQGGRGMPTPATSGRLEARTTVPSTTAAPRNGRPASSRRRPAPSSGRHRRRSRGGGRRAAAWTLSPRQPTVGLGEEDSDEKRGRTVSYSCPLVSRVALNDHESAGQSTVYRASGGGGNRTRVLRSRSRPSPSAADTRLSGAAPLPAAVPPRNQRMCPQASVGVRV